MGSKQRSAFLSECLLKHKRGILLLRYGSDTISPLAEN